MAPTLTANRTASACLHIPAWRCGATQWIARTARYAYAATGIGRSNVTIQATAEVGTSGYSRPNQTTSPMRIDAVHLISVGRTHSGGKRSCIRRSNDQVERRAGALPTSEAVLSRSSILSDDQRRRVRADRSNPGLDAIAANPSDHIRVETLIFAKTNPSKNTFAWYEFKEGLIN
jgi:hypothetical protein